MQNQDANQLPGADALPVGFIDSFVDFLAPATLTPEPENDCSCLDAGSQLSCIEQIERRWATPDGVDSHSEALVTELGNSEENTEAKVKNAKSTFKQEKEFLELTLKYQQVLAERDAALDARQKLESLCRELQRQNKILMDACKRVSVEGQNLRLDMSSRFQDAIKGVNSKLEVQKDQCLVQLKENEMLWNKLKQLADQFSLSDHQNEEKLKQKSLDHQLADLTIMQHDEKILQEQSQIILHEPVSQSLDNEKNLLSQPTADEDKFQQFQEALLKSNEVFETFKQKAQKMAKSMKQLKEENQYLKSKCDKSDFTLINLLDEREGFKKQMEKLKNQKDKLESLCRSLQAERKRSKSTESVTL